MFGAPAQETSDNGWVDARRRSWQQIDCELRTIAKRQRALDAEEAMLLCTVVRREIWRELGRASLLEYLEEVLGYGPKAAKERVRIALALDEMPVLAEALANGEQSYSAIRELTRVATEQTAAEWCDAARGKNVRQIEEMVSCRRRGDKPSDPPVPDLKPQVVRFEISTATHARLRHVQQVLAEENGKQLDDDAFVMALCDSILDGNASADDGGRARYQILTTICEGCQQAWQHGGGHDLPVGETDREIAECDAQRVGSDREPGRAVQDVPPKVRRFVLNRDGKRCIVPGCRASRHIDLHHLEPQHLGGGHEPENLGSLCSGHHRALHDGLLTITGPAPDFAVTWKYPTLVGPPSSDVSLAGTVSKSDSVTVAESARSLPQVGRTQREAAGPGGHSPKPVRAETSNYARVVMKTEATLALAQLGFTKPEARAVVDEALKDLPRDAPLEQLLRAALRLTNR